MYLPFFKKNENLSLEIRNQRLAKDLLFLFAFTLENKHHSVINLQFNNLVVTITPNKKPELTKTIEHPFELGVSLKVEGYLTNVFIDNQNVSISKKINKIIKKHRTTYRVEQVSSNCSIITIDYKN